MLENECSVGLEIREIKISVNTVILCVYVVLEEI